ncbi:hypothetical protein EIP86_000795 [Pleurotus ostreatoroseus]|nr:hypothetical protein EIP86_000795 [Pleurotus ostreatoroseus]
MPPRPRTRSATKKSDAPSTPGTRNTRKSAVSSAKRSKLPDSKSVEDVAADVEQKSSSSARKKSELVRGKVDKLSKPITVKGKSTARIRRPAKDTDEDEDVISHSDGASTDVEGSIADLDVADVESVESQDINLLDLEAEVDHDDDDVDDEDLAELDIDEDVDGYESSFIDDSALQEGDDDEDEEVLGVDGIDTDGEGASNANDKSADIEPDDDDDKPLIRPKGKSSPAKRRTIVSDDDASNAKKKRKSESDQSDNHPLNRNSQLHQVWFGPTAFLADTNRMEDWNRWRREKIMNNKKMVAVSGTNLEAAFLIQYNNFNFILDNDLLATYTAWVEDSMTEKRNDPEWVAHFQDQADSDDDSSSATVHQPRTPKKNPKGKAVAKRDSPETPKTPSSALAAKLTDLSLTRDECVKWYNVAISADTEAPVLPGVSMKGLQKPSYEIMPGGGDILTTTKFAEEVLRNDRFRLSPKNRFKLAMLVCTPTFGPWLYNFALVPLKALCTSVGPPTSPGSHELHRVILRPTKTHRLVAGIMFGLAAAEESTLLEPMLTKGTSPMYSKSITMWPINEHFSRIMSMANKFFNQYPIKFSLYKKGISFRARTRFVPLQGEDVPTAANSKVRPDYLSKTQLNAVEDEVPIYDATSYFTGKNINRVFSFGEHDIQCPRLTREIRQGEFIAIVHSLSTYTSGSHGGNVLSFNVYYAVLLASPK